MCLAGTGDRWQNYGVDMKQMGLLGNRAVFSTVRVRKKSHFNNVLIFLLVSGACMTPLSRPSVSVLAVEGSQTAGRGLEIREILNPNLC